MDPVTLAALIQGGTSIFNTLSNKRNNPANAASPILNEIPGYGRQAYNPFIQQGQQANQQLSPLYQQQATNPVGQYNDIMGQYQPSAGYQYKQGKLNQLLHNTAASGGYAGTGGDQQQRGELSNALMGEDMQQFLQNILGIQGSGVKGLQGQQEQGYNASGSLADYLGNAAGARAGIGGYGKAYGNQVQSSGLSSLAGLLGGGGGSSPQIDLTKIFGQLFGGGGGSSSPSNTASNVPLNRLNYMQAQSPRAGASGLFGG